MLTSMLYFYIQYIYIYYTTWEISSANMDFQSANIGRYYTDQQLIAQLRQRAVKRQSNDSQTQQNKWWKTLQFPLVSTEEGCRALCHCDLAVTSVLQLKVTLGPNGDSLTLVSLILTLVSNPYPSTCLMTRTLKIIPTQGHIYTHTHTHARACTRTCTRACANVHTYTDAHVHKA